MLHEACSVVWQLDNNMVRKERLMVRVVHMENLRGRLSIRRMFKLPNARIRELCKTERGE